MELRCFAAAFILVLIIKNAVATEDVAFRKWLWRGLTQFFLHPWEVSANGMQHKKPPIETVQASNSLAPQWTPPSNRDEGVKSTQKIGA